MTRNSIFLTLLIVVMGVLKPAFANGIKINEICAYPPKGGVNWIELINTSDSLINLDTVKLTTALGELTFPSEVGAIESGGIMLIIFDGKPGLLRDDKILTLHMTTKEFLPSTGELSLYQVVKRVREKKNKKKNSAPEITQEWSLIDTVGWGPPIASSDLKTWKNNQPIPYVGFEEKNLEPGFSIGVVPSLGWTMYHFRDTTPAAVNKKVYYEPFLLNPPDEETYLTCPKFEWESLAPKVHLQFSTNPEFKPALAKVILSKSPLTKCPKAVVAGKTYFWRMRSDDDQGSLSPWSRARSFIYKQTP